jgi:hypothetical protein
VREFHWLSRTRDPVGEFESGQEGRARCRLVRKNETAWGSEERAGGEQGRGGEGAMEIKTEQGSGMSRSYDSKGKY